MLTVPPLMLTSPTVLMPLEMSPEWVRWRLPSLIEKVLSLLKHLPSYELDTMVISAPSTEICLSLEMPLEPSPETLTSTMPPPRTRVLSHLMPLPSLPVVLIVRFPPDILKTPDTLIPLELSVLLLIVRLPAEMVMLPEISRPSDPADAMLSVPPFQVKALLPWMPSLSVSKMSISPELTTRLPSAKMPCLALPVIRNEPVPPMVRLPAACSAPLTLLFALSVNVFVPLIVRETSQAVAILTAAVFSLVSVRLCSVMLKALLLLTVREPLVEEPVT